MSGTGIEVEAHRFDHHWDANDYRTVSVQVRLGDRSSLEIDEEYDPAVEDADAVIARCADDLRFLLRRRGR